MNTAIGQTLPTVAADLFWFGRLVPKFVNDSFGEDKAFEFPGTCIYETAADDTIFKRQRRKNAADKNPAVVRRTYF